MGEGEEVLQLARDGRPVRDLPHENSTNVGWLHFVKPHPSRYLLGVFELCLFAQI